MKRKLSFVLSLVCLFCLTSCKVNTDLVDKDVIIAVKYDSANEIASEQYKDYTKVTYNSSSDVVLAIENGKADYGILDDFELISFLYADRNIKAKEVCEYSVDYCAYFTLQNRELQEAFNEAIKELENDGTLTDIQNTWFSGKEYSSFKDNNEKGTLTMLCDPNFPIRVFTNNNGDMIGLDVDIAREICNYLGYDLEIVTADFDELFVKLNDGEGDFIMSACEVKEERAEYFLLSDTYYTLNNYLIEKE